VPGTRRFSLPQLLLLPAWGAIVFGLWRDWRWFAGTHDAAVWVLFGARAAALLAGAAGAVLLLRALARREVGLGGARDLLGLLVCGLVALAAGTLADAFGAGSFSFWAGSAFGDALVLALAAWCALRARGGSGPRGWPPALRLAALAAANLALTLVAAELALAAVARLRPHPLLAWGSDPLRRMQALRLPAGEPYFGFPTNRGGYHDEEFSPGGSGAFVAAVLADSFGVGIVPWHSNFVTVAEEILRRELETRFERVSLHNFGIPGVGMYEYAWLLDAEVLPLEPDLVVLAVFAGNDVHLDLPVGVVPPRERRSLLRWLAFGVPRRLWLAAREAPAPVPEPDGAPADRAPRHLRDPTRERATFSRWAFRNIELQRVEVCNAESREVDAAYAAFFRGLLHFQARLGERLLVVLIPDEFQVNDTLWAELIAERGGAQRYRRELPQERTLAFCAQAGIACLDLLPALRAAERDKRTYHLRDTHWNAHGNAVAGRALADALLERVVSPADRAGASARPARHGLSPRSARKRAGAAARPRWQARAVRPGGGAAGTAGRVQGSNAGEAARPGLGSAGGAGA
jgi:hypothetical protein